MGRLIIISNRLPFSLDREDGKLNIRQSSGGLVSAIKSYFENTALQKGDKSEGKEAPPPSAAEKMWIGVADFPQEDWEEMMTSQPGGLDFSMEPLFVDKELYDN